MLRLLFRQPVNYWRSMSVMFRIQFVLVSGLVIIYFATRMVDPFQLWIDEYHVTMNKLSNLILHTAIFVISISTPFILLYLVPRQKSIKIFLDKPLTNTQALSLIGFYILKYHLIILIALIPVSVTMIILNLLWGIILLVTLIVYTLVILFINISFFSFFRKKTVYLFIYFIGLLTYFALYAIFYWIYPYYWIFDVVFMLTLIICSMILYGKTSSLHPEIMFNLIRNMAASNFWQKTRLKNIPTFLPKRMQVLFDKEFVSLWRNSHYVRLKFFTLLAQVLISFFIIYYDRENAVLYLTIVTAALIWLHYGNYFSDKYTQPDSNWFYQILPLRFFSLFAAKFLSEFIFIITILLILLPFLISTGIEMTGLAQVMVLLLVYSIVILMTMINFQMLFYENPRYAGYAYHFSVIFFVIMVINYRFVGPLMMLFMMVYFFYKNYRYFKT